MSTDDGTRPGYDTAIDRLVEALDHASDDAERYAELRRVALGAKHGEEEHRNRLMAALDRFETEHPKLTRVINDVAYHLSGSGI